MARVVKCDRPGCNKTIDFLKDRDAPFLRVVIWAEDGTEEEWSGPGPRPTREFCGPDCVVKAFAGYKNKDWKSKEHYQDVFDELPREGAVIRP